MSKAWTYLMQGDCLEKMRDIPDDYIDLILCDLPYGTTANKWDSVIPLEDLWKQYWRLCRGAVVLTSAQPFTTALISSQLKYFRYCLVWDKCGTTGFQTAKIMPLRRHEDIVVFYKSKPIYNPRMEIRGAPRKKGGSKVDNGCYGDLRSTESYNNNYYPTSIIQISNASKKNLVHPTQKPVALMEYLIETYTNMESTVLDNTMGSGTTGVACVNTNRNFIGIEKEENYFSIATNRINDAKQAKETV